MVAGRVVDECWDFILCGAVMVMQVGVYVGIPSYYGDFGPHYICTYVHEDCG